MNSQRSNTFKMHRKAKKHRTQKKRFFYFLKNRVVTCSMASQMLGIPQKCLTWYKRQLEESGQLWEVKQARCKITGFTAAYLTTDPDKAPTESQLKLF